MSGEAIPGYGESPRGDLEAQRRLLHKIQRNQAMRFSDLDITREVARRINPTTGREPESIVAAFGQVEMPGAGMVDVCRVIATTTEAGPSGYQKQVHRYFDVARGSGGVFEEMGGFNRDQAQAVVTMVTILQQAQEDGLLPDLSSDCTFIYDPGAP